MSLRIVDSLLFEISRVVETVFDELEYRSARASLKAAQKPVNTSSKRPPELSRDRHRTERGSAGSTSIVTGGY